ncbi:transporter substrate-binding domain-containing protein [Terasakiella sp. SH-1]|uniref:substrate-binding periplasmic protein n=1 Tax=Terasakiella sp. SH-1 TaxID=2560057 RepID=UPI0014311574|nr:transporter substrate-binding domain-containing protein [Terasakiella sp. SH-1]
MRFLSFVVLCAFALSAYILPARAEVLRAATLQFPPYSYEDQNGNVAGIAVETVRRLAKRLGYELDIKLYPWARALSLVKQGSVDMLFTAYKTKEREEYLYYSASPLIVQKVSFFVKKDSLFQSVTDITRARKATTATRRKVSYGPIVDDMLKQGVLNNLYTGNDDIHLLNLLKEGRVNVVPLSQFVAYYNIQQAHLQNDIREIHPPVQTVPSYLTFSKALGHHQLAQAFSKELNKMRKDGSIQKILEQWLANNRL